MRILVTGTRKATERRHYHYIRRVLCRDHEASEIVAGESPGGGVDWLARDVAESEDLKYQGFPVRQDLDGPWPAAGHRRNQRMLVQSQPDLVVAFPAQNAPSKGTMGCVEKAVRLGLEIHVYPIEV